MKIGLKLAVFLLLSCPARTSTGVVCNTQKQMERFIALNDAAPGSDQSPQ
jgi:hypothetical protein